MKQFREYFEKLNKMLSADTPSPSRKPILAEVIHVAEGSTFLTPVTEVAEVQKMINAHNISCGDPVLNVTKSTYGRLQIQRIVHYTGYLISNTDSSRLINQFLNPHLPSGLVDSHELKYMANNVLIAPRTARKSILDKAGGLGKKLSWRVTGTADFENKLWAVRVAPVPESEKYYTDTPVPVIVLAARRNARPVSVGKIQNWLPVAPERSFVFETVVGEKAVLRVGEEDPDEGEWESQFSSKQKRRRQHETRDEDITYSLKDSRDPGYYQNGQEPSQGRQHQHLQRHTGDSNRNIHDDTSRRGASNFRGGRGRGSSGGRGKGGALPRGGGGGGGGRIRGRGGGHPPGYRSLDDYGVGYKDGGEDKGGPSGGGPVMNY